MIRFGLVLGGGGYAGTAFHAGVVTALARAGWDARDAAVMVGTSAGAVSAALLGAGFPPREYVSLILEQQLSAEAEDVLTGTGRLRQAPRLPRPRLRPAAPRLLAAGLRRPGTLPRGVLLAAAAPAGTVDVATVSPSYGPRFADWPQKPVWITAVDLRSGQRVVFGRTHVATVAQAVSASVAIPGYFAPVVIDDVPYVDGGAWSTNNADLLLAEDLDVVLVSAPSSSTETWACDAANWVRAPVRLQLLREVERLKAAGKRVVVFQPDRALRRVIGVNPMALGRRGAIALASWSAAAGTIRANGLDAFAPARLAAEDHRDAVGSPGAGGPVL